MGYFGSAVGVRRGAPVGSKGDGGADRDRTDDPLLAKQMLSQLSYSPGEEDERCTMCDDLFRSSFIVPRSSFGDGGEMVGLGRFELPTSRLSGVRSNQLSYRPACRSIADRASHPAAAILLSENVGKRTIP